MFVNQDGTFRQMGGTQNDALFSEDGKHLNIIGKKKMLCNLGLIFKSKTYATALSGNKFSSQNKPTNGNMMYHKDYQSSKKVTCQQDHKSWRTVQRSHRQLRCHFCGISGHMKQQCRHGNYLKCFTCGSYGHKSKNCSN